jgi:DNA-binding transcriptional MerR regulator
MAGKSPEAFRTISEVADWLDRPAHVLRFWESKFNQVKPVKRAGGRRYYRPEDMLLLGGIKKLLHDDGMTIKGAQKVLREQGVRYVSGLSQPLDEDGAAPVLEGVVTPAAVDAPADAVLRPAPAPDLRDAAEVPSAADWPEAAEAVAPDAAEDAAEEVAPDMAEDAAEEDVPAATVEAERPAPALPPAEAPANSPAAPPTTTAPEQARPALGEDLPQPPALEAVRPEPGLLSAIAARRTPLPPEARVAMGPILARLDDLVARLSGARKS